VAAGYDKTVKNVSKLACRWVNVNGKPPGRWDVFPGAGKDYPKKWAAAFFGPPPSRIPNSQL